MLSGRGKDGRVIFQHRVFVRFSAADTADILSAAVAAVTQSFSVGDESGLLCLGRASLCTADGGLYLRQLGFWSAGRALAGREARYAAAGGNAGF